jgi:hypothetical protein
MTRLFIKREGGEGWWVDGGRDWNQVESNFLIGHNSKQNWMLSQKYKFCRNNFGKCNHYILFKIKLIWLVDLWCFNATFNNISVISWRSVLLVEETRVPRENQRPAASHWQTLSHNVVSPEWDSNSQH